MKEAWCNYVLDVDKVVAYYTGYATTGLSLRKEPVGWLLVVRAESPTREPKVLLEWGEDIEECFRALSRSLRCDTKWAADKYKK